MKLINCPFCNTKLENEKFIYDPDRYECWCEVCGHFALDQFSSIKLEPSDREDKNKSSILSHAVRKMQRQTKCPLIDTDLIDNIFANNLLPSPAQQADNFVLWLGDELGSPGDMVNVFNHDHYRAIIGATSADNFRFILDHLVEEDILLEPKQASGNLSITLSFNGWQKYQQIKQGHSDSKKAFMAMPFGDPAIEDIFKNHFKPAVQQTGFELYKLNEKPKAGSIDDRLRVEILTSRFLIADLTNGNHGAYWEAGFAEGLGKPVIYTCEEQYFNKEKTHFDTNHLHTVIWNENDKKKAEEDLKVTIRATLPDEAVLVDK